MYKSKKLKDTFISISGFHPSVGVSLLQGCCYGNHLCRFDCDLICYTREFRPVCSVQGCSESCCPFREGPVIVS